MIPNCRGCEVELFEAYLFQDLGYYVGLEGMGERTHCSFFVLDENGNFIVE